MPDSTPLLARIVDAIAEHDDAAAAWLRGALASLRDGDPTPLRLALARARRKLDDAPLGLSAPARQRHGLSPLLDATSWRWLDLGRAALVLAALEHTPPAEQVALVEQLVRTAELGEQESLLRALPLLPEPARFVPIAVDSCRTNATTVFAAIAVDNPLPAASFPAGSFNQMVLKAIFMGVPVAGIVGLETRASPELARMARDYASERRAAGRSVPADVDHVVALCGE